MGIKERRSKEKAALKRQIMDEAIKIINQDGYENLSIRKLAARIEYSPTTIYLYYKDKAQIIAEMSEELFNKVVHNIQEHLKENSQQPIEQQVKETLLIFIKSLTQEPEAAKAIMYSGVNTIFSDEADAGVPENAGHFMFEQILAVGIEQKIIRPSAAGTAWMISSAVLGFVLAVVENQIYLSEDFEQYADDFVEILMRGICW